MALSTTAALAAENERQILSAFRAKRATAIGGARHLADLGLNDSRTLKRMVSTAVLRKAGPDRYFLDEDVLAAHRSVSGRKLLPMALVLGLGVVAAAVYAMLH